MRVNYTQLKDRIYELRLHPSFLSQGAETCFLALKHSGEGRKFRVASLDQSNLNKPQLKVTCGQKSFFKALQCFLDRKRGNIKYFLMLAERDVNVTAMLLLQ